MELCKKAQRVQGAGDQLCTRPQSRVSGEECRGGKGLPQKGASRLGLL